MTTIGLMGTAPFRLVPDRPTSEQTGRRPIGFKVGIGRSGIEGARTVVTPLIGLKMDT